MKTQYRIVGRFVKDEKPHQVAYDPSWSKENAEYELQKIIKQNEIDKQRRYSSMKLGAIGVLSPYLPEYELVDLKIQSRQVSEWS